ncbi:hypothetical protein KJ673_01045 [Patescibacteria group bacterium]|nr:hypothetical protein [Patescibacteria group bacterium]MBU4453029.1 hypothetical protein [Patescibacteria group bacterium]MCG2687523.1 hypothetical protein [Candidatus Parcubacteria bacterium]
MKIYKSIIVSAIVTAIPLWVSAQVVIDNPLGQSDVRVIIGRVIQGALSVSGTLALLMVVYGGILWLTDMGTGKQIQKGKDILIWATLGIILIAGAYVITTAIFNAVLTGSV